MEEGTRKEERRTRCPVPRAFSSCRGMVLFTSVGWNFGLLHAAAEEAGSVVEFRQPCAQRTRPSERRAEECWVISYSLRHIRGSPKVCK